MIEIRALIDTLSFRFAKTMPEHPHEYVVRTADNASLDDDPHADKVDDDLERLRREGQIE